MKNFRTVISSTHSLPALDMALAMLLQLKKENRIKDIYSIFSLNQYAIVSDCEFLFRTLAKISKVVLVIDANAKLLEQLSYLCKEEGAKYIHIEGNDLLSRFISKKKIKSRVLSKQISLVKTWMDSETLYLRSHADVNGLSYYVNKEVRVNRGCVGVYLEGCYPPHNSLPMSYFSRDNVCLADKFYAYSNGHINQLETLGYNDIESIGFPKLFPAWREAVVNSKNFTRLEKLKEKNVVVIITRGETPKLGPQIMPNALLKKIVTSIIEEVCFQLPDSIILIKPHPSQDRTVINKLSEMYDNVSITEEHPSVLSSIAKLVVTTWSTSIIDAMVFKCPVIEYFIQNDEFLSKYPSGSAFKNMGIPSCDNKKEFSVLLSTVIQGSYIHPDVASLFAHKKSLEFVSSVYN